MTFTYEGSAPRDERLWRDDRRNAVFQALGMAFATGWEILWPLILGFALSGVVQAVVSQSEMSRLLPNDSPRSIAKRNRYQGAH